MLGWVDARPPKIAEMLFWPLPLRISSRGWTRRGSLCKARMDPRGAVMRDEDALESSKASGRPEVVVASERAVGRPAAAASAYTWGGAVGLGFGMLVASYGFWRAISVLAWGVAGVAVVLVGRVVQQRVDVRRAAKALLRDPEE